MMLSVADTGWDFRAESTDGLTHGIHPYPAKMVPQVAERLISDYGTDGGLLFDPYCGSGTSLLEANLAGMDAVGTDLNPLARLISRAKTTPLSIEAIDGLLSDFESHALAPSSNGKVHVSPSILNRDYWFSREVVEQLESIRSFVAGIGCPAVRDFARVAFSLAIRECSWTKKSEFKLVRMPAEQMAKFEPDARAVMVQVMARNRRAMIELGTLLDDSFGATSVHSFNTVHGVPESIVAPRTADLIVTSPPYGDSHTTVAYGQFSRLSNQWLGFADAKSLDSDLMGGRRRPAAVSFGIELIDSTLERIATADTKRASDVASFFLDYSKSIANVSNVLRRSGIACYVVGNRTVRGVTIPTDEITIALFELNGFEFVRTFQRNIPNKRMPYSNSPTNVAGASSPTIRHETVIVCRKR